MGSTGSSWGSRSGDLRTDSSGVGVDALSVVRVSWWVNNRAGPKEASPGALTTTPPMRGVEPECLFHRSYVGGRSGLLAFTEPVAFQEDGLGEEPGAAGRHPDLGWITRLGLPRALSPTHQ